MAGRAVAAILSAVGIWPIHQEHDHDYAHSRWIVARGYPARVRVRLRAVERSAPDHWRPPFSPRPPPPRRVSPGALRGARNGFRITRFALPSIVVTIGTLSLYRGTALVILGDGAITGYPAALSTLGNGYIGDLVGLPWLQIPIE